VIPKNHKKKMAKNQMPVAKKSSGLKKVLSFVAWLTGVIVSLVVGNALIIGTLVLPQWLGGDTQAGIIVAMAVGWIVIITTLLSVVLAIIHAIR